MRLHPGKKTLGIAIGIFVGLVLNGGAQWWSQTALAQSGGTTFTTSVTRSTFFESPPACSPVGSSRDVLAPGATITNTIGPSCIGINEVSVPNPSPACGSTPPDPVLSPNFGTTFIVTAGNININATSHIDTFQCVAAVPTLPWTFTIGLGGLLLSLGAWAIWRRTNGSGVSRAV